MNINKLKEALSFRLSRDYSKIMLSVAAVWFSIRVIPKPSRIAYPCQRATMGMFAVKLGITVSAVVASTSSLVNRKSLKILFVLALVGVLAWDPLTLVYSQYRFATSSIQRLTLADVAFSFPSHRVVQVHSSDATSWDFSTGYYWQYVDQAVVDGMVEEGVKALTGAATAQEAWQNILPEYVSGDTVGIKVNGNDFEPFYASEQSYTNTLPQLINAVIKGVKNVGVPESDIWVIEPTGSGGRIFYQYYYDLINALYPSVRLLDNNDISFGGHPDLRVDFPYTSSQYITDQMADIDHLIILPIMKAITPDWGITGTIKMMQGNIQNQNGLHNWLTRTDATNPDVLIYQNPHIIGKTRLIVGDGIYGMWTGIHFAGGYGGTDNINPPPNNDIPRRWITFNNGAPNLLFFSVDPVAIDSVMDDHIVRERNAQDQVPAQTLAPFNEPILLAGAAAGLGIHEDGPPYTNIDYIEVELGAAPPPTVHDVAVTSVTASPITALPGQIVNVTVIAKNEGTQSETFTLAAYANTTLINSEAVILDAASTITKIFSWDTTAALGVYLVRATASVIEGEVDTADNTREFDAAVAIFPYPTEFPLASFTYSPTAPLIGGNVIFNGSSSLDPDGTIVSYVWDFGDGNHANGVVTNHAYSIKGNYTVTLTVTDNDGLSDIERKTLAVAEEKSIQPWLLPEYFLALLIAGIVAVAVAVASILYFRKRSQRIP